MRTVPALTLIALLGPALALAQPSNAPAAARPPEAPPSIAPLVEHARDAVVSVTVREKVSTEEEHGGLPFFFQQPDEQEQVQRGLGSGLIIDPSGLVITNNHVVSGAENITVGLGDGRTFPGKVLGHDEQTDIALVKLQGDVKNLPVPPPTGRLRRPARG